MPTNLKYTNWAKSTLAVNMLIGATTMTVKAGEGSKFPTDGVFYLTVQGGVNQTTKEIVKVTSRTGDNMVIERAQDGTVQSNFYANDRVELAVVRIMLSDQTVNTSDQPTFQGVRLDTAYSPIDHVEGRIFWDNQDKTLAVQTEVNGVTLQVGQEMYVKARNNSGSIIYNGQAVYINGALGNRPTIALAQANNFNAAISVIGVATQDIANNADGHITIFGYVRDINTSSYAEGDTLYLSPSTPGGLTKTAPSSPNYTVFIAKVTRSHAVQGSISVKIDSKAWEESKFEPVITTLPIAKGGTGQTTATAAANALLSLSGATAAKFLTNNGSTISWADLSGGTGVQSVGVSAATPGLSVSNSPITSSGNIEISVANDLLAIENLSGIGYPYRVSNDTWQLNTSISIGDINGTGQLSISNSSNTSPALSLVGAGAANAINIKNTVGINSFSVTQGAAGTSTLFTFATSDFRSCDVTVQVKQGTAYQIIKLLIVYDGTDVSVEEFGRIGATTNATFSGSYTGGVVTISTTTTTTAATLNGQYVLFKA